MELQFHTPLSCILPPTNISNKWSFEFTHTTDGTGLLLWCQCNQAHFSRVLLPNGNSLWNLCRQQMAFTTYSGGNASRFYCRVLYIAHYYKYGSMQRKQPLKVNCTGSRYYLVVALLALQAKFGFHWAVVNCTCSFMVYNFLVSYDMNKTKQSLCFVLTLHTTSYIKYNNNIIHVE